MFSRDTLTVGDSIATLRFTYPRIRLEVRPNYFQNISVHFIIPTANTTAQRIRSRYCCWQAWLLCVLNIDWIYSRCIVVSIPRLGKNRHIQLFMSYNSNTEDNLFFQWTNAVIKSMLCFLTFLFHILWCCILCIYTFLSIFSTVKFINEMMNSCMRKTDMSSVFSSFHMSFSLFWKLFLLYFLFMGSMFVYISLCVLWKPAIKAMIIYYYCQSHGCLFLPSTVLYLWKLLGD